VTLVTSQGPAKVYATERKPANQGAGPGLLEQPTMDMLEGWYELGKGGLDIHFLKKNLHLNKVVLKFHT
jgi:hypothetical protein